MMRKLMRRQKGFTLIELLIVVAIIGIIAALLIPNFLESLQKAKQKRTMADMRNGGTAFMAWLTDEAGAAAAGATVNMGSWGTGDGFTKDYSDISSVMVPGYVNELPARDGWKKFFSYALNTGNPLAIRVMAIYSGGRNGTQAQDSWPSAIVPTTSGPYDPTSYDNDLLWADGSFFVWPEKVN